MKSADYIGKIVEIKIDKPYGSRNSEHGFIYELNYGYVTDEKGLDAYYLGVKAPISTAKGKCIAIIHRTESNQNVLVVMPEEKDNISDEEIEKLVQFQERHFLHEIIHK